ncbi:MAG: M20/M25/M40 family metallo-hydrolase [Candidatus Hodarchaeales archaeon]|jgi:succinyl-diaminopimelate desuccinylase
MQDFYNRGTQFLEKLIRFNTVNYPDVNIYPDLSIFNYLEKLLKTWNNDYKIKSYTEGKYKSIYITPRLEKSCFILFLGHLDVVPVSKRWKFEPFELTVGKEKNGFGRGSKDCKGSVVSALLTLFQINTDPKYEYLKHKIGMYLSTDEETGGKFGANVFFQDAKRNNFLPRYVINVDGGPRVVYKRRAGFKVAISAPPLNKRIKGSLEEKTFQTRVLHDNNRHSAYFVRGVDTHALLSLSKYLKLNPHLKLNKITGEWIKGNVIPDSISAGFINTTAGSHSAQNYDYDEYLNKLILLLREIVLIHVDTEIKSDFGLTINPNILKYSGNEGTEVQFDIRIFLNSDSKNLLLDTIKNRIPSEYKFLTITCTGSSGFFYTDPQNELVTTANQVLKQHKLIFEDEMPIEQEGASDARYASLHGVPVIDLGPKGGNIHGDDEFISLESMIHFSEVYIDIIKNLLD